MKFHPVAVMWTGTQASQHACMQARVHAHTHTHIHMMKLFADVL